MDGGREETESACQKVDAGEEGDAGGEVERASRVPVVQIRNERSDLWCAAMISIFR